jgi:hypothetical protein
MRSFGLQFVIDNMALFLQGNEGLKYGDDSEKTKHVMRSILFRVRVRGRIESIIRFTAGAQSMAGNLSLESLL